jgi:hypothetical protein
VRVSHRVQRDVGHADFPHSSTEITAQIIGLPRIAIPDREHKAIGGRLAEAEC